jgi:hypothetical protein
MSAATPKRRPSASPVCYADEKDIAPGYMWAESADPRADSVAARKPRVKSKPHKLSRKSAKR